MKAHPDDTRPQIPDVGEGKRGEAGHIGYLLRQAGAAHRIRMEQALSAAGITLPQYSLLTMLRAYPGVYGADLARLTLLTPQTVCVIVGNLERDGLVTRSGHPEHGRIRRLDLTEQGRACLERCRPEVDAIERAMLDGLPPQDEAAVRRWLVSMAKASSAIDDPVRAHEHG